MKNFLERHKDLGILFIRLGIGAGFAFVHGWPKISAGSELWTKIGGAMANLGITFAPTFWGFMASATEFGGGILLLFGLFTRTASAFLAFNMIVAMTQHLVKLDPWGRVIYPMELLAVFLALIFVGAGKYSLDELFFNRNKS